MNSRRQFLAGAGALVLPAMVGACGKPAVKSSTPLVETSLGKAEGFVAPNGIATFRGLPYGATTGGANRFLPPKPAAPWTGVRNASAFGPTAPQAERQGPAAESAVFSAPAGTPMGEDCLVLNVWTPAADSEKRPVMVWMHGGGFVSGSASAPLYDGGNLAKAADVVVVGVNHRLNAFGYTYLGEHLGAEYAQSANVGQLDMIAALQWVKANIEKFGGDPARVLIFGESGGGQKVSTLMAMPAAKGLFHRAVVQSGPGFRMGEKAEAVEAADVLLKELGLSKASAKDILTVEPAKLTAAFRGAFAKVPGDGPAYLRAFCPLVDGADLPAHPFDPTMPAVSADVPLIIGYNRTEWTYFWRTQGAKLDMSEKEMRESIAPMVKDGADKVLEVYRAADPKARPWDLYIAIATDAPTAVLSQEIARRKTAQGPASAWHYRFDWETQAMGGDMRSPHTMEIPFVFNNLATSSYLVGEPGAPGQALADRMSKAWGAFARDGKPAAEGLPDWPAYNGETRSTMLFNTESQVANDPNAEQRKVLAEVIGLNKGELIYGKEA